MPLDTIVSICYNTYKTNNNNYVYQQTKRIQGKDWFQLSDFGGHD